ncbi:MAG: hypothetical protein ACYTFG_18250, partial [Planctomycetota bacterium]
MRVRLKLLIPGVAVGATVLTCLLVGMFRLAFGSDSGWDIVAGGSLGLAAAVTTGIMLGASATLPFREIRRRIGRSLSGEEPGVEPSPDLPEVDAAAYLLEELLETDTKFRDRAQMSVMEFARSARDLSARFGEWSSRLSADAVLAAETGKAASRLGAARTELARRFKTLDGAADQASRAL